MRPYDLRHPRASLLLAAGTNVVEVAAQMGHSPSMCLSVYAHTIADLRGRGPIDATAEIMRARQVSAGGRLSSVEQTA